jgi:hypothetical protein
VLKLAKMFLDPLDNESYGGKYGISINVGTLLHETNIASERWSRGAARVPKGVFDPCAAAKAQPVNKARYDEGEEDEGGGPISVPQAARAHVDRVAAAAAAAADALYRQAQSVEPMLVQIGESEATKRRSSGAEEAHSAEEWGGGGAQCGGAGGGASRGCVRG